LRLSPFTIHDSLVLIGLDRRSSAPNPRQSGRQSAKRVLIFCIDLSAFICG